MSPGIRIGPYEITGAIGAGGMGEVYRARHELRAVVNGAEEPKQILASGGAR